MCYSLLKGDKYENPTNTEVFDYLRDTYNLKANILDKDALEDIDIELFSIVRK